MPPDRAILDVRAETSFLAAHAPGSASIPLEELPARVHELPRRGVGLRVLDADPARAQAAASFLAARGHPVEIIAAEPSTWTETGAPRIRLWQPNEFLSETLKTIAAPPARALDLACGTGRDAVYLALAGWRVTAIDVLPDALDRVRALAHHNGVSIETELVDLERPDPPLHGEYQLVTLFRYLHRPLFPILRTLVRSGGWIAYETFHAKTASTGRRPTSPNHLLNDNELPTVVPGWRIAIARDAIERDGRFFSSLLAQRPA